MVHFFHVYMENKSEETSTLEVRGPYAKSWIPNWIFFLIIPIFTQK